MWVGALYERPAEQALRAIQCFSLIEDLCDEETTLHVEREGGGRTTCIHIRKNHVRKDRNRNR